MEPTQTRKLSASLALQGIQEAAEEVTELEARLEESRRIRDELVTDAVYAGVSVARLARVTGLSRQYIYRISPGNFKED